MNFDLRTLYWAFSVSNVVMAVALWWAFGRQMREGLGRWTVSLVIQAAAWLLFGVRGIAPDTAGFLAANVLLTLSFAFQAAALVEFERRKAPLWLLIAPAVATAAILAPLLGNAALRFTAVNLLHGAATGAIAALMLWLPVARELRARHLIFGGFAVASLLFLVRGTLSVAMPSQVSSSLDSGGVHWALHLLAQAPMLFIAIGYLVLHKERADARLRELATIDPLTGALNRRAFMEVAERELAMAARNAHPLTVLLMDIDYFKRVNDSYGHRAGDTVLRHFSARVADLLRKGDVLVRYGGEEFCLLLPHTDAEGALTLAERIRSMVEINIAVHDSTLIPVTVSIGVSTLVPNAAGDILKLLDRADAALYRAKARGRNCVVVASDADGEAVAA